MRHLIARLGDESPTVTVASVRALERLGEPSAMMPLYELVQNETADRAARHAAAEALVKFGLLRRHRTGPSPMFIWLAGMALVIVAVGAASSLGAWSIVLFVAGAGALGVFALRRMGQRGDEDVYVGPNGEELRLPSAGGTRGGGDGGGWADGFGDSGGWGGDGGGGGNGGGGG